MLRRLYTSDTSFACAVIVAVQLWLVVFVLQVGIAFAPDPPALCTTGQTAQTASECVVSADVALSSAGVAGQDF